MHVALGRKHYMSPATDLSYHTTKPETNHYEFREFSLPLSDGTASGLIYIEQLAAPDGCHTPGRPWMVAQNTDTKLAIFFQPTCKLWSCEYCAGVNARRWTVRAITGAQSLLEQGIETNLVTVTSHEKLTPAQTLYVFPKAWPILYRRYKRAVSKSDPKAYIAIPERHEDMRLHCHLLISGSLGTRWWKDNARECGMGYESKEDEVKTLGVGGYVAKYMNKNLKEQWPKGKRRVNTSRTWPAMPDLPIRPGWKFATMPSDGKLMRVLGDLTQLGYSVFGVPTSKAWQLLDELSIEESQNA